MRHLSCLLLLAVLFASFGAFSANAAFKSAKDEISPAQSWNPKPDPADIILSMPCGLSLAMRAVAVPGSGLLQDRSFAMGVGKTADESRRVYERRFEGHIAAPFTREDLPQKWLPQLGKEAGQTFYFIGKYEISQAQWQAVMDAISPDGAFNAVECPRLNEAGANLPKGGISWFEAQQFLERLNAWLAREHPQDLPRFAGTQNIGFLRLPTEEEWEFAARGGARVPKEWWADKDIFPFAEGKELKDYAVFSQETALKQALPIGSRNPNPLGVYDSLGNLREMLDGFFRLSVSELDTSGVRGRLHGAAGGILSKGGSYRDSAEALLPGRRDELALYTAQGAAKPADLGLRLVLAGLNIPNAQRLAQLRKEESAPVQASPGAGKGRPENPLDALGRLAQNATPELKNELEKLRALIEDQRSAQERADLNSLEHSFRALLYQAETLRAFAFRYSSASRELEKLEALMKGKLEPSVRSRAEQAIAQARADLADYLQSLKMGASYYKESLARISKASEAELKRLAAQAREEYGGKGIFDGHIRANITVLEKYLAQVRQKGQDKLNGTEILRGILPAQHFKLLGL